MKVFLVPNYYKDEAIQSGATEVIVTEAPKWLDP